MNSYDDLTESEQFIHAKNIAKALYQYLGQGGKRITFAMDETLVLKIPRHRMGEEDNRIEAELYRHDPVTRAWCELRDFEGVTALVMERLLPINILEWKGWGGNRELPRWADELGDGPQLGQRRDGTLLVYDYAYEKHTYPELVSHLRNPR